LGDGFEQLKQRNAIYFETEGRTPAAL